MDTQRENSMRTHRDAGRPQPKEEASEETKPADTLV